MNEEYRCIWDGFKLIGKDLLVGGMKEHLSRVRFIRSFMSIVVFGYAIIYLLFYLLWSEFVEGMLLLWSCFILIIWQAFSHWTQILLANLTINRFVGFGAVRLLITMMSVDYIGLISIVMILPDWYCSYSWFLMMVYGNFSSIFDCRWIEKPIFLILLVMVLESNRIPLDLIECENELVSGINVELVGMWYGLFASVEYATIMVNGIIIASMCLFYNHIYSLFIFMLLCVLRATFVRIRYIDLIDWTIYKLFPITFTVAIILSILV